MKVRIWGSRGSLPASTTAETVRSKILKALTASAGRCLANAEEISRFVDQELPFAVRGSYGGNTSCVEIVHGGSDYVLCDAGSGLRDFSTHIMHAPSAMPARFHIFLSHLHWDHLHGFPFFTPAYLAGNRVDLYGFHAAMEETLIRQMDQPCFPVPFSALQADITFHVLEEGEEYTVAGLRVRGREQDHPGKSYGYSFEKDGRRIVYSTDAEHKEEAEDPSYPFLHFIKDADLLIFDAQYSYADATASKVDWGHSSNVIGVELAMAAGVKHLCMFHSEPTRNDETLERFLHDTRQYAKLHDESYPLRISLAYEGLEIEV